MKNKCLVCNSSFSSFRILKTISIGIGAGNRPCIYLLLDQYQNVNLIGLNQMHFRSKDMTLKIFSSVQMTSAGGFFIISQCSCCASVPYQTSKPDTAQLH